VTRLTTLTLLAALCQGAAAVPPQVHTGTLTVSPAWAETASQARHAAQAHPFVRLGMPPQAAGAGSMARFGIRLVEVPVARRKDPRARTGIVDHLKPGTTISRRVEVSNSSNTTQRVEVYAAAATIDHHRFITAPDHTHNELTTWISVERPELTLSPHEKAIRRVTIRVPPSAPRAERYGVIWAQETAPPDAMHNVGMINRVGIPIYLDIGSGGEPPSDMRIDKLTPARTKDGRPQIIAQVHNTGGRALSMSGTLWLSDGPGGLRAGPYAATLGVVLAPGDTAPVTVVLDRRLPNGPWKTRMLLQSGMVQRTASATITFPHSGIGRSVAFVTHPRYAIPLLISLVRSAVGSLFLMRRRRRRWVLVKTEGHRRGMSRRHRELTAQVDD
jgi:hypothetical protein